MFEMKFGATFRPSSTVATTLVKIFRLYLHKNSAGGYKVRSQPSLENRDIIPLFKNLMLLLKQINYTEKTVNFGAT
jgi:hypothetical protein